MRSRTEPGERLLVGVETAHGSGSFDVDARLRVEEVREGSSRVFSIARISVRLDDAFDSAEALRRYHPDRRVIVTSDAADPSTRQILFEGYPPVQWSRWDGRIGREEERFVFTAEHVFERLSRLASSMVYGRRVRNAAIADGLISQPDSYAGRSVRMTALTCVFNPDGVGNRAATPLAVRLPSGDPRCVDIFTWDDDRAGRQWTYASVLRYLVWFHRPHEGPVHEGNLFVATDTGTDEPAGVSDALRSALSREPVSLDCEGMSLADALSAVSKSAGIHVTTETENHGGRPWTKLRVWSADEGPLRQLYLARGGRFDDGTPRYDSSNRSVRELLAANNTYRGQITWDHRQIVNSPIVIGGVKQHEMTLPLMPGWLPRASLDNVPVPERVEAMALALTPAQVASLGGDAENHAWFRQYHRNGSEFLANSDIGRLWVLNEDGRFDGARYNRAEPFDDYQPFDFASVADETVTAPGAWMRRRRRLLDAISQSPDSVSLGVWVEISFDHGVTWQPHADRVRVLADRVGVYFECANPTEVTPTGTDPAVQNMWYAMINQSFRVRVTGMIESDERLIARPEPERLASPTLERHAVVVLRPDAFGLVSRDHTVNVLASATPTPTAARDDREAIGKWAASLAKANQGRRVQAVPRIPWIETGYRIGDRITEIRGRHLLMATTLAPDRHYPAVIGRRFVLAEGRYETELALGVTVLDTGEV